MRLDRAFFERPVLSVAPDLLGCVVTHRSRRGPVSVRLVEVEAYDGLDDPGSHAYRGETARNRVMFGAAGFVYVYFTYGMHWCMNMVCGPVGRPSAVLLRAGEVVDGEGLARERRGGGRDRDLARGPARLCKALGIAGVENGLDALDPASPVTVSTADSAGPELGAAGRRVASGPRVGLRLASDRPWRFWLDGDPAVSAYRSHPRLAGGGITAVSRP